MLESKEERELNHWWKCKKWSYANLNRLFIRCVVPYCNGSLDPSNLLILVDTATRRR